MSESDESVANSRPGTTDSEKLTSQTVYPTIKALLTAHVEQQVILNGVGRTFHPGFDINDMYEPDV